MIYVNGDSWTSGWPDEETFGHREFSWPHLLSTCLNVSVVNDARAASSNSRIYRRTFDYLLNHRPETAIVCLTSWTRMEMGNADSGKIHQYVASTHPEYFLKDWHPYLAYSTFLRQIISLQIVAKSTGTKLYLLDTFKDNLARDFNYKWFVDILKTSVAFDAMDDERIAKKYSVIQDLYKHIDFDMFISKLSYEEIVDGCKLVQMHPVQDGHQRIASFIYKFLSQ